MSFQQKDMSGSLFKNDDKEPGSNRPDYSGTATINGVEHFMDAWLKTSESGRKWMSFAFKAKTKQSQPQPQRTHGQRRGGPQDDQDSPPF